MDVSIIIPTLDEAAILERTLSEVSGYFPHELIVTDGGSRDATLDIARKFTSRIVQSRPGRALQMNAAAREATGALLLFLHADSRIDGTSYAKMVEVMENVRLVGGAFSLAIESDDYFLQMISALATLRARYFLLVYGDQAIFVRKAIFKDMGGFPSLPICEDLEFYRQLKKTGPVILLNEKAYTSGRRWVTEGVFLTTARNILIATLFLMGFPPRILSKWYVVIR